MLAHKHLFKVIPSSGFKFIIHALLVIGWGRYTSAAVKKDRKQTDLKEGLGARRPRLEHDGENGEEDDLDGGAARVPVGPADAVLGGHRRGLEEGGRPRPLRDDGGGRQTDAHLAARVKGRVKVVGIVVDVASHELGGPFN